MYICVNYRRPSVHGAPQTGEEELEAETLTKFKDTILGDAKYVYMYVYVRFAI